MVNINYITTKKLSFFLILTLHQTIVFQLFTYIASFQSRSNQSLKVCLTTPNLCPFQEDLLATDDLFIEYFNAFLALPVSLGIYASYVN